MTKWNRDAMRIRECRYLSAQDVLSVAFSNGDHFEIPVESLLPESSTAAARWDALQIGETNDHVLVPVGDSVTEIPWDRFRAVADPAFRRHLAAQATVSRARIAKRLGQLRRAGGLTQQAVAQKSNLPRSTISRLESGQLSPTFETLLRILTALGRPMEDLTMDDEPALQEATASRR